MSNVIKGIAILTLITLAWPASSQARSGVSKASTPKEITITKTNDKSSTKIMESSTKHSSSLRGNNSNDRKGGRYLGQ